MLRLISVTLLDPYADNIDTRLKVANCVSRTRVSSLQPELVPTIAASHGVTTLACKQNIVICTAK